MIAPAAPAMMMIIIQLNIDGLDVGYYEYVLTVYDETGNWAEDSVIVRVYEAPTEPTSTTTTPTTSTDTTGNTNTPTTATQPLPGDFDAMLIVVGSSVMAILVVLVVIGRIAKKK